MQVLNFYHLNRTIPDNAVYIGRANRKLGLIGSRFANPFPITEQDDRDAVVTKYGQWLWGQLKAGTITEAHLLELEGKDLVCYCAPKRCHGDVLKNAVAWARLRADGRLPPAGEVAEAPSQPAPPASAAEPAAELVATLADTAQPVVRANRPRPFRR